MFGGCDSISITENSTIIANGHGDPSALEMHISGLTAQLERNKNNQDNVANLSDRLNRLKGGLAVIYIGGKTNVSTRERYDLADDAFNACKAALDSGILPGGGAALARIKQKKNFILTKLAAEHGRDSAYYLGAKALVESLDAVFNRIIDNSGLDKRIILEKIIGKDDSGTITYDLNNRKKFEFDLLLDMSEKEIQSTPEDKIVTGDAEELGVIDPEYVIENEVLNATDCAGLLTSMTSITVNVKSDNSIAEAISNLG